MKYKKIESIDEIKQGDWVYMVGRDDWGDALVQFTCVDNGSYGMFSFTHGHEKRLFNSGHLLNCFHAFYKIGE